ncbi:alkaline phosphatase PhoX, partial [Xanthomonas perforans]
MPIFDPARRQVLKGSAAVMAAGALGSLSALQSRQAQAATSPSTQLAPVPSRYGPLAPVADQSTGLPLLQLPQGFSYRSFGWSGDRMDDGQPCPDRHDGMAVVGLRRPDWRPGSDPLRGLEYVLIRNHERGAGNPFRAPAMYDTGIVSGTQQAGGGTTTLSYGRRGWGSLEPSLGGTLVNCAGGTTPWGTWLSCEEIKTNAVSSTGRKHGYVFEVDPDSHRTTGRPLVGLGRFSHEAVAIDPRTGIVYLTEDDRNKAGLYRFIPNDRRGRNGSLENGGRLQAARVRGRRNADLTVASIGQQFQLEWVDISEPDLDSIAAPAG